MEKKKKTNWFMISVILLFIIYISLYMLNATGYYDGSVRRKVDFTEEQITKFESDVQNGNIVDLEDYLEDQTKDYTNGASKLGYTISKNVDNVLNSGIKGVLKILNRLLS